MPISKLMQYPELKLYRWVNQYGVCIYLNGYITQGNISSSARFFNVF